MKSITATEKIYYFALLLYNLRLERMRKEYHPHPKKPYNLTKEDVNIFGCKVKK